MKIILIAPSGGGKGTQAKKLRHDFGGIPQISTGDIFRQNIKEQTELGKKVEKYVNNGIWVPDDIVFDTLMKRLKDNDCNNGFMLDGFPRTLNQAKMLAKEVDVDVVIEMDLANETVLQRLAGRWTCKECGEIHSEHYESVEKCKKCGGKLFQRDDDKEEKILLRLKQYRDDNKEILEFYRQKGILVSVMVEPEYMPDEVYALIKQGLKKHGII